MRALSAVTKLRLGQAGSASRSAFPLITLLFIAVPLRSEAQSIGHVYSSTGDWRLSSLPARALEQGDAVSAADSIRVPAATVDGAAIVLWLSAGRVTCTTLGSPSCSLAGGQKAPCVVSGPKTGAVIVVADCLEAASGRESRVFAAVLKWIREEPRRYVPLLSRAPASPTETVVQNEPVGVDIAPALAALPAGRYRICARHMSARNTAQPARECAVAAEVSWVAGTRTVLSGAWSPGLYDVSVSSETDRQNAWILVAAAADYTQLRAEFERAAQIAASWRNPGDPTEKRTFLRAFLMSLANPEAR